MAERLRGYTVWALDPLHGAVLVWARTARDARRMGYPYIESYHDEMEWTDMRARWLRDADPAAWGVTEPTVLEPDGCPRCGVWGPQPGWCPACGEITT